jgi:hypothetical protein
MKLQDPPKLGLYEAQQYQKYNQPIPLHRYDCKELCATLSFYSWIYKVQSRISGSFLKKLSKLIYKLRWNLNFLRRPLIFMLPTIESKLPDSIVACA